MNRLRMLDFDRLTWLSDLNWLTDWILGMRTSRVDPLVGVEAVVAVVAIGARGAVRAVGTVGTVKAMETLGTVRTVGTLRAVRIVRTLCRTLGTLRRNYRNSEVRSDVITEESSVWASHLNEGSFVRCSYFSLGKVRTRIRATHWLRR